MPYVVPEALGGWRIATICVREGIHTLMTTSPPASPPEGGPAAAEGPADPMSLLRTTGYLKVLALAAIIGVPVSAVAYGFLKLVSWLQHALFASLPNELGFHSTPTWWPLPLLALAGAIVAPVIAYLPGRGGHSPADGFQAGGPPTIAELPGVALAALASLSLGVVLGPEAPLIAIGGGLGAVAVRLAARDAPPTTAIVIASAGSFAAISTLLGSPIVGAFLLLEAAGLGGPMLGLILVPGLLAAGIGSLIFIGLDSLTGFGTFSLAIPGLPAFDHPTVAMFAWAVVIGLAAAVLGAGIRRLAQVVRPHVEARILVATPLVGLSIAGLAIAFQEGAGHSGSEVLFSGQTALPGLVQHAAGWTVGALVLLVACKGLAYGLSLSSFRGGPIFPAMFIGAAGGIALTHLPGLTLVPAVAMGIGAMSTAMLKLPFTSTLLASLLLLGDAVNVMPLVIVAVVVTYVTSAWLAPSPAPATEAAGPPPSSPAEPQVADPS